MCETNLTLSVVSFISSSNGEMRSINFELFSERMTISIAEPQALVSFKKYMPPPLPYFKVNNLPFTPSPLRLNIFRLFVILSLTQLYRYTPEIFLFSTATFKYKYPQTNWKGIFSESRIFYFSVNETDTTTSVCAGFFICIRNSLDRPCVTMPPWSSPLKYKVSLLNTDNCSNADYKNMFNSKLLTFDF